MGEKRHVVIADDDPGVLAMLEATLEGSFQVACAADGDQALRHAAARRPDLVVLDVEMPGVDGYEACRRLRAQPLTADVPVIFHSSHTGIDERLKGYAVGGDDYLGKPFDPEELLAKIARVLAQRERQRSLAGQVDAMTHTALASADIVGEVGVVLDYQRQLFSCNDYADIARALLEALARYGLDGCVRIRGCGTPHTGNRRGGTTALEGSILDHLQGLKTDQRVHAIGPHTGLRHEGALLFVRDWRADRPEGMDKPLAERKQRQLDNIALLLQGAVSRVAAIDAGLALRELAGSRQLVQITREALVDISARGHTQRMHVHGIFEHLSETVETSFISLGLTQDQEDFLSDVIRRHSKEVANALVVGQEAEQRLQGVIDQLARHA